MDIIGVLRLGGTSGYSTNVDLKWDAKRGNGVDLCGQTGDEATNPGVVYSQNRWRVSDKPSRQRSRRRALVAAALAGTLGATALACSRGGPLPDGPLVFTGGDTTVSMRTNPHTEAAYGFNVVRNVGADPVTNVSAELVRDPNRKYVGVSIEPVKVVEIQARQLGYLGAGAWPFPELENAALPLDGFTFKPDGQRVEILFIVKVSNPGRWYWPKTRVTYEAAGKEYAKEISNGFLICAPETSDCDAARP